MENLLIAEISNHHYGDLSKAKELIRVAKESGADAVKGQAFLPKDMIGKGVMSDEFYRRCSFEYFEYVELIDYGKSIGIPVFFTILSYIYSSLTIFSKYFKSPAILFGKDDHLEKIKSFNRDKKIISVPHNIRESDIAVDPDLFGTRLLFATAYNKDIDLDEYFGACTKFNASLGISHHCKDLSMLMNIILDMPIHTIEKHFFLGKMIKDSTGAVYRDCLHSADPKEFYRLAKHYKG